MKVGIIGASGYTGEELLRLLACHPRVEVSIAVSRRLAGQRVNEAMPRLRERLEGLMFQSPDAVELAYQEDCEVFFLAMPHGASSAYARALVDSGKKVIDLSADFRLSCAERYKDYYGHMHPDVDLLNRAAYVLPELSCKEWCRTPLVACPGCYPTSILIPLIPLLRERVIRSEDIRICAFSGVSGAGRQVKEELLFCERAENAKAYGLPKHRHLSEIEEQLSLAAGTEVVVQFVPHLAPMRRGLISTITASAESGKSIEAFYEVWQHYYEKSPFVSILPSGCFVESQHTVGSNRIDIAAVHDSRTGLFVITAALDNLLKGGAGQGVQIMNLWCGFPETTGL